MRTPQVGYILARIVAEGVVGRGQHYFAVHP